METIHQHLNDWYQDNVEIVEWKLIGSLGLNYSEAGKLSELHSNVGDGYKNIGSALEEHYARFIKDRLSIIG